MVVLWTHHERLPEDGTDGGCHAGLHALEALLLALARLAPAGEEVACKREGLHAAGGVAVAASAAALVLAAQASTLPGRGFVQRAAGGKGSNNRE